MTDGRVGKIPENKKADRNDAMVVMAQSGFTLQAIGDVFGITRERVRQIVKLYTGEGKLAINARLNKAKAAKAIDDTVYDAMDAALSFNLHCIVCGAWNIREGKALNESGESRYRTCSKQCSKDRHKIRHRIERELFRETQAKHILLHRERFNKYMVDHAERIMSGDVEARYDSRLVHRGTATYDAVMRVRNLRASLGTTDMFDDDIATVRIVG